MADLSHFSTADLEAMAKGDLGSVSDEGLQSLHSSAMSAPKGPSVPESAARQFASGAVGNFDDELIGGLDAFGRALGIKNLGSARHLNELMVANPTLDRTTLADAYRQGRDAVRGQQSQDAATNPGTTLAANIAGAVASPISKVGMGGELASGAVKAQKVARLAKAGVAQGAIYGAGASNTDLTSGRMDDVIQFGKDTGTGAFIGGTIPVAAAGIGAAAKGGASKIMSWFGGVKPATIEEYTKFADRINAQPDQAKLKEISDEFVGKLSQDVDSKKLSLEQAQEAFKGFQSDLKDAYRTAGYDARDAVNSAKQTLKDAHGARLQQLSSDVYDSVNQLKDDVKAGSSKALATLDKPGVGGKVDLAPLYSEIDKQIGRASAMGTDEGAQLAEKLKAYKERQTAKYGDKIFAPDAKRLVQGLDQITEYSPMAGSFDKAKNSAFKSARAALDGSIKEAHPAYAKAMEPVAADADLLSRVSDFGDKQSAASFLSRIDHPTQADRAQALSELGKKYGADFISAARPENLPESRIMQKALAAQDSLRPDRVSAKIDQTISSSRYKSGVDAAQAAFDSAQNKLAPFKSLAPNASGQTQVEQKLTQLGRGGNIELEGMFKKLGALTDTDFVQAMKDRSVLAQFQKGAMNGSRNTLMGAVVGWAVGGAAGGAIGAGAGRAIDQWGPAVTKKILDASIQISKSPKMETIRALDLPAPVKQNLMNGLRNYLAELPAASEGAAARVAQADNDRRPAKGTQIQKGWGAQ